MHDCARYLNVALCVKSLRQRKFIMKIIINLLFLISISSITFGQKAIKLNAHSQYKSYDNSYARDSIFFEDTESKLSIIPGVTFSKYTAKDNFYEFGLSRLYFNVEDNLKVTNAPTYVSIDGGAKTTTFNIGFRYDYNYILSKNGSSFLAYFGLSSSIAYDIETNEPKITSSYKRNWSTIRSNFGIVPRLIWKLNSLVFIDLNIPINIIQVEYTHQRIHNPSLPLEQQKNGELETTLFPKNYEVRLGVGVFLFKGDKDD